MARVKRCIFCMKPLRSDGYCENEKCVDYERTKIHDEGETKNATNE